MAELTANDISRLLAPTTDGIRSLNIEQEKTTEYIVNLNSTLAGIGVTIDKLFKQITTGATENRPPLIKGAEEVPSAKDTQPVISPLEKISSHLSDIKTFLVNTFKPVGLSGSTEDIQKGEAKPLQTNTDKAEETGRFDNNEKTALGWLGGLFAVGALGELSKVLGIGAAGGTTGLLAKVASKIFKWTGPVMRRIPILGSLFSFYEAYKKFTAGGIDNILFGLMDIAAGIGYAVPGIGTGIGIGLDVLQYFLKNKANEWKKETGETSFCGSMYDKLIEYLSETPMIKWMGALGAKFSALWDDPSLETFGDFVKHLAYGPLMPFIQMLSGMNDAGLVLGLTDKSGNPQKLFGWLYEKVEDYIITPVKDMFTVIFDYISNIISSVQDNIANMVLSIVDKLPETFGIREKVKSSLGLTTDLGPGGEKNKLRNQIKQRLGDLYPEETDKAAKNREEQKANKADLPALRNQLKQLDNQLKLQESIPINQPERLPTFEETEREYLKKFESVPSPMNTVHQTQINTYVAPMSPSFRLRYSAGAGAGGY